MRYIFPLLIYAFILSGCDELLLEDDPDAIISLEENLQPPPALDDGWDVSELAAENINASRIQTLITSLHARPRDIHSLLIIRNNRLVSESYFGVWHRERLHTLRSASKSFVSTMTGIAVDKGYIGLDQKVFDFFPDYAHLNDDEKKTRIEIKHLLTMTAGLAWDEKTYMDERNDEFRLDTSDDRLAYILGKEMQAEPGTKFVYNSGCPFLQAAILKRVTNEDIYTFSDKHFFRPLKIKKLFLASGSGWHHSSYRATLFTSPGYGEARPVIPRWRKVEGRTDHLNRLGRPGHSNLYRK
jgi:CubicO group peptidase (beta-lactamase class C family)